MPFENSFNLVDPLLIEDSHSRYLSSTDSKYIDLSDILKKAGFFTIAMNRRYERGFALLKHIKYPADNKKSACFHREPKFAWQISVQFVIAVLYGVVIVQILIITPQPTTVILSSMSGWRGYGIQTRKNQRGALNRLY
ncbi:MAG: hypothetical protein OS112_00140 [Methanoregula sp.]|nr:MAG: hypothetical protein OS112_00140 [Methanoregula sp.]